MQPYLEHPFSRPLSSWLRENRFCGLPDLKHASSTESTCAHAHPINLHTLQQNTIYLRALPDQHRLLTTTDHGAAHLRYRRPFSGGLVGSEDLLCC